MQQVVVYAAWANNCIARNTVGCNYLPVYKMSYFTQVLILDLLWKRPPIYKVALDIISHT